MGEAAPAGKPVCALGFTENADLRAQAGLPACISRAGAALAKFYCALAISGLPEIADLSPQAGEPAYAISGLPEIADLSPQAGEPACGEPRPALGDFDGDAQADRVEHAVEAGLPAPLGELVQHRLEPGQGRQVDSPLDDLDLEGIQHVERLGAALGETAAALGRVLHALQRQERVDAV